MQFINYNINILYIKQQKEAKMHLAKKEKEFKKLMRGTELFPRDAAVPTIEKQPTKKSLSPERLKFLAAFSIEILTLKKLTFKFINQFYTKI
jgi:hypothetical protein